MGNYLGHYAAFFKRNKCCVPGIPRIPAWLDELLRNIRILQADSRDRPLVEEAFAHVLLQTVALGKNQSAGTPQIGNIASYGHFCSHQPQRAMAFVTDVGDANWYDQ